jgi:hypothetical protein
MEVRLLKERGTMALESNLKARNFHYPTYIP